MLVSVHHHALDLHGQGFVQGARDPPAINVDSRNSLPLPPERPGAQQPPLQPSPPLWEASTFELQLCSFCRLLKEGGKEAAMRRERLRKGAAPSCGEGAD